jgi:hypothetical protein
MGEAGAVGSQDIFEQANRLRKARQHEMALALFRDLLADPECSLDEHQMRFAGVCLLKCLVAVDRWPEAEIEARNLAQRFPYDARMHQHMGRALYRLGRYEEARVALEQAIRLDPDLTEPRNLMRLMAKPSAQRSGSPPPRPWPRKARRFRDVRAVVRDYVLRGRPEDRFIRGDSIFTTMGSCFAGNLASRLGQVGHEVNYEPIGEDVNSTYANRRLLDWVERGPTDDVTRVMEASFGSGARRRLLEFIRRCDVFILTMGVAPCFFHRETGELGFFAGQLSEPALRENLLRDYVMRTTTVAENVDNVRAIIDAIDRLSDRPPRVVLTVSPVALEGTTEFESAVVADCISKSTLRLACHELIQSCSDRRIVYWPSFEIVRWLGAHYGPEHPPVFGAEDNDSHHVSAWLVDLIIELFLDHHGTRAASKGISEAAPAGAPV